MRQVPEPKHNFNIPKVSIVPTVKKTYPIPENHLLQLKENNKSKLVFSFSFFDRSIEEFNLGETVRVCDNWFISLLDALKEVSNLNRNELMQQRQHYDAHPYEWEKLDNKFPFDNDFLEQVECAQFRISKSKGRVHGFIVGSNFYIVWLDPHHNLYPDEKYGGVKYYSRPLTCYEILESNNFDLLERISKLEKENDELLEEYIKLSDEKFINSPRS